MPVPPLPFPHTGVDAATSGHRQVLIPYAATTQADWNGQSAPLRLPHLDALLGRLAAAEALEGEESDPNLPHERMAGLWRGWADLAATRQAPLPWAALTAASTPSLNAGCGATGAWAFMTPCHWTIGTDQIRLENPADLQLDDMQSQALLAILQPWFAEDGISLHYERADRWLIHGEALQALQPAALERVFQRDVRHWMPAAEPNRTLQRLHSEVQMLLYTHPFNAEREARGQLAVNAFWLHGNGVLPASRAPVSSPHPEVWDLLREPALSGDRAAWQRAWEALDAGPMAQLLQHVQAGGTATLALCGERNARSYTTAPRSVLQRVRGLLSPQRFGSVREAL